MEPFIRTDQFQFIKSQTQILIKGYASVNDKNVLSALKTLAVDKIINLFADGLNEEQKQLVEAIIEVEDGVKAERFLGEIKTYVIPFKRVSEEYGKEVISQGKEVEAAFPGRRRF